jgi:hypothetical protein
MRKKMVELDKIDKNEILNEIRKHFAEITPEEFLENLKRSCPYLFWDKSEFSLTDFTRAIKRRKGAKSNHQTDLQPKKRT